MTRCVRIQDVVSKKSCFLLQNPHAGSRELQAIAIIVIQTRSHWHWQSRPCACSAEQKLRWGAVLHASLPRCNSHFLGETTSSFWLTRDETPLHIIMTIFICSTRRSCSTGPQVLTAIVSPSSWLWEWAKRKRAGWGLMNLIYCFVRRICAIELITSSSLSYNIHGWLKSKKLCT